MTFISIDSLDVPTRMRMQRILWVARRVKRRGHECMGFPKASVEAVVPLFPFISFAQIISGFISHLIVIVVTGDDRGCACG